MKKKLLSILLIFSVVLVSGCAKIPKLQNGEELVAKIDGKEISANDLYKEIKKQYGTSVVINMIDEFIANKEIDTNDEAEAYADSRISQLKLQYQTAGQDFDAAVISWGFANETALNAYFVSSYKKDLVVENYIKENLTEKEINKYYEDEIYGDLTVRHILIAPEVTSTMTTEEKTKAEEAALAKAKDLITKLNEGADFAELAKENSDDEGTAVNGGLYSDFNKNGSNAAVSEFFEASLKLEDGKYTTEPVKTEYGYHIILKISQKSKPELELVKDTINDALYNEKLEADEDLSMKTWAKIREKYNLSIVDTDVKNIYDSTLSQLEK